jgi:hypothetical protein
MESSRPKTEGLLCHRSIGRNVKLLQRELQAWWNLVERLYQILVEQSGGLKSVCLPF